MPSLLYSLGPDSPTPLPHGQGSAEASVTGVAPTDMMLEQLRATHHAIDEVVTQCVKLSEEEVYAVAQEVIGLRDDAKKNLGDLQVVVAQFKEGSGENTIIDLIRGQSRMCEQFVRASSSKLQEQHGVALDSLRLSSQIGTFARKIMEISAGVKVLTLNANIESARAGTAGRAFAAIAGRLRELSGEIETANKAVQTLAENLGVAMPKIATNASDMIQISQEFSDNLVAQLGDFETSYSEAQTCVQGAVQSAQVRTEKIVSRSYEVLSHLQFQDRLAQKLQEIPRLQSRVDRAIFATIEKAGRASPDEANATGANRGDAARVAEGLRGAPALSLVPTATDPEVESGEVLLF